MSARFYTLMFAFLYFANLYSHEIVNCAKLNERKNYPFVNLSFNIPSHHGAFIRSRGIGDSGDMESIRRLRSEIQMRIDDYSKRYDALKAKSGRKRLLVNLSESINELNAALKDIELLISAQDVDFRLAINKNKPETKATAVDSIVVYYDGTDANLLHELTHGAQYLKGEVDFVKIRGMNPVAGPLGDQTDEVVAYRREFAFVQKLRVYDAITGKMTQEEMEQKLNRPSFEINDITQITTSLVARMADRENQRIAIYENMPVISLNSSSSVGSVFTANRTRFELERYGMSGTIKTSYKEFISKLPAGNYFFTK